MAGGLKPFPQIILIGNKTDIKTNKQKKYKAPSGFFLEFYFSFCSELGDKGVFIAPLLKPQQIK